MGISIIREAGKKMGYVAKENLYLNEGKDKVVKEGDPDARFTLTVKGAAVSQEDIDKYKLKGNVEEHEALTVEVPHIVISGAGEGKVAVVKGQEIPREPEPKPEHPEAAEPKRLAKK
jgi:hypothetical protein